MINLQEKLKNFNLKSLSNFDLNQIDAKLVLEALAKRKDILIITILIGVTIFASYYLFNISKINNAAIQDDLAKLEEKQTAAIEFEKQKNRLENVQKTIPQGFEKETEIIKKIIDLASEENVKVVFYSPGEPKNEKDYSLQVVDFIFESSYDQMLTLINAIEKNKENLRILSWKNEPGAHEQQVRRGQKTVYNNDAVTWKISVSSALLNYEE